MENSNGPVIETRNLVKRFGDFEALKGINLQVKPGEVMGFLGPNGAGKSTTIRVLMDEIRATSGSALLLGLDSRQDASSIHSRLGYLPSDLALFPKLTGKDTVAFFGRLRGGVEWQRVNTLAERFGADLSRRTGELSTGNRQKLGLILAFMHDPELLIMDEPITGLDPLVQHELHSLIRETVAAGKTVFLSSHTLSEVQRVADRVTIIRNGELVSTQTIGELATVKRVQLVVDREVDEVVLAGIEGVSDVEKQGKTVTFMADRKLGDIIDVVSRDYRIVDITAAEADLEDIFLTYYQDNAR